MTAHPLLTAGSAVLASAQLITMWLLARKHRGGWLASITASVAAVPYDILTGQYGFLVVDALYLAMAWRAWRSWGRA